MKALVVDDDRTLADLIAFALRREGFVVYQAQDGAAALARWRETQPDIILLDVNLPHAVPALDGFVVCRKIRAESDTPIILLTVRSDEEDIILGLQSGADDYIIKPFSPRQMVARVHAVLRRAAKAVIQSPLQANGLLLDPTRREVRIQSGEAVALTALEYRLLEVLLINAGQTLPIATLIDSVWGPAGGDRDMLRQLVRRLRVKLGTHDYIETIAGVGYGLRKP